MLATVSRFQFEGHRETDRKTSCVGACAADIALLVNRRVSDRLILWHGEKNETWRSVVVDSNIGVSLLFNCWAAVRMESAMKERDELGREEMAGNIKTLDGAK